MRKFLILALGVTLVGCSSNEDLLPDGQNANDISFVGYTQSASSRAALEATALPTDGTYALFLKARYQNTDDANYADYFVNATDGLLELDADKTNNSWVATGRTYPLSGKMNFMGFALPKADAAKVTSSWTYNDENGRVETLSLKCEGREGTEDILFSTMSSDFTCPQTAVRALTFNHTLSWIRFTAMVNTDEKLIIKKIELNDVVLDGTVTVPGTTTATSANATWSALGDEGSYPVLNSDTEEVPGDVLTTTKQEEYGYLIVVPGKRTTATITYAQITGKDSEGRFQTTADLTTTIKLENPDDPTAEWLPGNRYSYNLSITSNNIAFTTDVQPWIQNPQGFELK